MFCKNCGRQIPDNAAFCPACGTKRSGGDTFGEEKSGRDIKNLPSYAKENDLNRSGDAIGEAARFYKVPADHVLVLCDDITLPAGTIRIRAKGEAGGHNGLKSIISALGSSEFPRIKIGVGNNTPSGDELVEFVLGKPSAEDMKAIMSRMDDIEAAQELIKAGQLELAQSRHNRGKNE